MTQQLILAGWRNSGNLWNCGNTFLDSLATFDWNGGRFSLEYAAAYSRNIDHPLQTAVATYSNKPFPLWSGWSVVFRDTSRVVKLREL